MSGKRDYIGRSSRSGQAGIFIVLNLTLVFGTLGLAVDVGWAYYTRQTAQAAADSAALAAVAYASASGQPVCGSGGVVCNSTATACNNPPTSPPTTALQAGCLYAQTNGFVNNGTTQWVSMAANNTAPPGISNNTPSYWVQAKISTNPFTLFGGFAGVSQFNINVSSIAAVSYYSAGACVYAVGSGSIAKEFQVTGAATVTATCGIFVNSTASNAYYESGSAAVTASQILVNGGYQLAGASSASPTPLTNQGAQSDPLASYSEPTFSNVCPSPPYSVDSIGSTTVTTLEPGTYCGGITIGNSANVTFSSGNYTIYGGIQVTGAATVSFGSGLYIINGEGSSSDSIEFANSAAVSGSAVTFFITGQYGQTIGPVAMTGATTVNLSAPTSGTYQGMLFLQDRNYSYTASNTFANSASSVLQGTLYFPTTNVSYSGASTTGTYTAVIGKTVTVSGSAAFKNDPTGEYTGLATTVRGLIQ